MIARTDVYGLPLLSGFRLQIAGVWCWATCRPSREGPTWVIRGPGRRVLGSGRSVAVARRLARIVLETR